MRKPYPVLPAFAMGLSLASIQASADDATPDTVVITATQVPTPQSQLGSSVTIITGDEIEARQERLLPDVLKAVPGLNLVQTGGPGGLTSVFMRGTNSNHTKVLIDGIDVSDPSNANASFDFSQLLTQDIERVEVLRGPQSGLYGSDAIGGVINIITKSGNGPATLKASVEAGSFETANETASLSGSNGSFHYSENFEHWRSGATPVTPLDLLAPAGTFTGLPGAPAGAEQRIDDSYDNRTFSSKLGYDISSTLDLGMVARYTDGHYFFTGDDHSLYPLSFPAYEQSEAYTSEAYGRIFAHALSLNGILDQTLGIDYTHKRTANYSPPEFSFSVPPVTSVTLDTGDRFKVDWRGAIKLIAGETLVLGAEHSRDEISEPLSAATSINSGYAELQTELFKSFYSAINVRYDDNSRFGSKATYRLAPTYVINETGTSIKASLGTGFKAPTLSELFQNFPPTFFANPNLKPESSLGWDAGVEQSALHGALTTGVTYFHNRLHDLIDTDVTGTTYANVGRATTQGVESFAHLQASRTLTLRIDYTYTEATDDTLDEELLRRPKHKGSLGVTWQPAAPLTLDATLLSVSGWVDINRSGSIPRLPAPGYTTADVSANYVVNKTLTLTARVNNLFDRHYENPVGFLQPSIGAYGGVKITL